MTRFTFVMRETNKSERLRGRLGEACERRVVCNIQCKAVLTMFTFVMRKTNKSERLRSRLEGGM